MKYESDVQFWKNRCKELQDEIFQNENKIKILKESNSNLNHIIGWVGDQLVLPSLVVEFSKDKNKLESIIKMVKPITIRELLTRVEKCEQNKS